MALVFEFRFLLISPLLLLPVRHGYARNVECPSSFNCGELGSLQFPFTKPELPDCGLMVVHGCDYSNPRANKTIKLEKNGRSSLRLSGVYQQQNMITVFDRHLHNRLQSSGSCEAFSGNISIPASSPLISFDIRSNITLFKCNHKFIDSTPTGFIKHPCADFDIYHYSELHDLKPDQKSHFSACSVLVLPTKDLPDSNGLQSFLSAQMNLDIQLSDACNKCHNSRGQCQLDRENNFCCMEGTLRKQALCIFFPNDGFYIFFEILM